MAYIAPSWVNDAPPDLDAEALQDICDTLQRIDGTDLPGKASLDGGKVAADEASAAIVTVTETRALELTDAGKFLYCTNAEAATITVQPNATVPFPVGTEIEIFRGGAGTVTLAPASGVTFLCSETSFSIGTQYTSACLKQVELDAWAVQGNIG